MRLGLAILAAALIAAAAPASAATWSKARPLVHEPGTDPVTLHLAAAPSGETAFVWIQGRLVQARVRSAGGRLGRIFTLRRMRHSQMGLPQIAIGPGGTLAAVWMENLRPRYPGETDVYVSVGSARGFGRAQLVGRSVYPEGGSGAGAGGGSPKVAIASDGTIAVLWVSGVSSLQAWWKRPGSRSGTRQTIPAQAGRSDVGALDVALGFDARGTALAGWTTIAQGPLARDQVAVRVASRGRRGSRFGASTPISPPGTPVSGLDMAVGADGTAAAIWTSGEFLAAPVGTLSVAIKPPGAPFGSPEAPSPGCEASNPDVAVSSRGRVLATWEQSCRNVNGMVAASARTGHVPLGSPERLPVHPDSYTDLALADSGQAVCVFSPGARATVRPPAGPFGEPHLIARSRYSTTPRVAIGGRLAITAWQAPGGFYYSTLAL